MDTGYVLNTWRWTYDRKPMVTQDEKIVGGKAKNLKVLQDVGLRVPDFNVIGPDELFDPSNYDKDKRYAVRSSATLEDGKQHSFAGQFETYLGIRGDELESYVEKVRASVRNERIKSYLNQFNITETPSIAVIIQEFIEADVSGVGFGIDPVTGNRQVKVISAVYGLGEGLVSGELDADTFRLSTAGTHEALVNKTNGIFFDDQTKELIRKPIPKDHADQPTLNHEQIKEVGNILTLLESKLGSPQDIEFAYKNNTLYLLQTRPITSHTGEFMIWDNSNIVESYPGITTPLTFTFIIQMYESVYRQFVSLLGVSNKVIEENSEVFANTLGLVRGRVYYNLLAWYKMLAMVPGYSLNAEYMENMMGVKERFELQKDYRMSKRRAWARIVGMVFKMIWLQMRLPAERRRFQKHLVKTMEYYHGIDFHECSIAEIKRHYKNFEETLLRKWKAPLTNDFFAMIWFGMLQKQTQKLLPDHTNIHNDLLCGSSDIISTEPVRKSLSIASTIQKDDFAKTIFLKEDPETVLRRFDSGEMPEIRREIEEYIDQFGDRCIGELKLESISYAQEPERYVQLLKQYVVQGVTNEKLSGNLEEDIRENAEKLVKKALNGKPLKRLLYRWILKKARQHVSARENLRFERTRGFGMVRKIFDALGHSLKREDRIDHPRDIFYLELNEILNLSKTDDLRERISNRKSEFSDYHAQEPPSERFFTYGFEFTDQYIYNKEKEEAPESDLHGTGCCPGIIEGKVRVIMDPHSVSGLDGDILVTRSTDPGWVTLFPTASAIIVEKGSLLSHSAIVSREMGIPCIVSVTGLLRTLKTGDHIRMNGSTGQIELLNE